ncbi:ribosome biogenesis protein SLX9-domain-containing protein, partial [Massariosphaeria phaeospora]
KKRTTARAKSSRPLHPHPRLPTSSSTPSFASSKKDKRTIKHSSFVSKIEKPASSTAKRRRPSKKLVADLESLANALPSFGDDDGAGAGDGDGVVVVGQAKIQRKSLKSRPGATKRLEKLEREERARFQKNLGLMAAGESSVQDRWKALRNHVKSTMEVKKEFVKE